MRITQLLAKTETRPTDFQPLAVAHGMLVAAEHVLCPLRLMRHVMPHPRGPAEESVYWYLYIAAAGAVGELRQRLRRYKPYHAEVRAVLDKDTPSLLSIFDQFTADDISDDLPLQMCVRIRDKHWAHWDFDVSEPFVRSLKWDGTDRPIAESARHTSIEATGIPWVREAWFLDLEKTFSLTAESVTQGVDDMTTLMRDAAFLAREAAMAIMKAHGISLSRREVEQAD